MKMGVPRGASHLKIQGDLPHWIRGRGRYISNIGSVTSLNPHGPTVGLVIWLVGPSVVIIYRN